MTTDDHCKNCSHSKEDHQLSLGRSGDGDFLAGTSMPSGKLESNIVCSKCTCKDCSKNKFLNEKYSFIVIILLKMRASN